MEIDLKPLTRFLEHLPKNGDVELTILKCHLLIEEQLDKIVTKEAKHPDYVKRAKLRFAQKMYLARAYSQLESESWLWGAIKCLNDTRNELTHGLSVEEIQKECNSFIEIVESAKGKPGADLLGPTFNRFHWAAFKVFTALTAYTHFDPTKLRIPTLLTGNLAIQGAVDTDSSPTDADR